MENKSINEIIDPKTSGLLEKNISTFKESIVSTSKLINIFNEKESELSSLKTDNSNKDGEISRLKAIISAQQKDIELKIKNLGEERNLLKEKDDLIVKLKETTDQLESRLKEISKNEISKRSKMAQQMSDKSIITILGQNQSSENVSNRGLGSGLNSQNTKGKYFTDVAKQNLDGKTETLQYKAKISELEKSLHEALVRQNEYEKSQDKLTALELDIELKQERIEDLESEIDMLRQKEKNAASKYNDAHETISQLTDDLNALHASKVELELELKKFKSNTLESDVNSMNDRLSLKDSPDENDLKNPITQPSNLKSEAPMSNGVLPTLENLKDFLFKNNADITDNIRKILHQDILKDENITSALENTVAISSSVYKQRDSMDKLAAKVDRLSELIKSQSVLIKSSVVDIAQDKSTKSPKNKNYLSTPALANSTSVNTSGYSNISRTQNQNLDNEKKTHSGFKPSLHQSALSNDTTILSQIVKRPVMLESSKLVQEINKKSRTSLGAAQQNTANIMLPRSVSTKSSAPKQTPKLPVLEHSKGLLFSNMARAGILTAEIPSTHRSLSLYKYFTNVPLVVLPWLWSSTEVIPPLDADVLFENIKNALAGSLPTQEDDISTFLKILACEPGKSLEKFILPPELKTFVPSTTPLIEVHIAFLLYSLALKHDMDGVASGVLKNIGKYVSLVGSSDYSIHIAIMLVRVFSAYCSFKGDKQRVRVLCYDILLALNVTSYPLPLIANMAVVYSEAFYYDSFAKYSGAKVKSINHLNQAENEISAIKNEQGQYDIPKDIFLNIFESILAGFYDIYIEDVDLESAQSYYEAFIKCGWNKPESARFLDKESQKIDDLVISGKDFSEEARFNLLLLSKLCRVYME